MTIEQINSLSKDGFIEALGWVYEHSPWVAERAWANRPFASLEDLARRMNGEVDAASKDEQLALLRAHPELGTRMKIGRGSAAEQAGAGLDQLTEEEYEVLLALNERYSSRFGFPFIYAVKGSGKGDILNALFVRLEEDPETEFRQALWEVSRIARFRLEGIAGDSIEQASR